jgi:hypothetical protein
MLLLEVVQKKIHGSSSCYLDDTLLVQWIRYDSDFQALTSKDLKAARKPVSAFNVIDISIREPHRRKGMFTELVKYITVERGIAFVLSSVMPHWLKEKLKNSNLWFIQNEPILIGKSGPAFVAAGTIGGNELEEPYPDDYMMPTYCRFVGIVPGETEFRLF